MKPGGIKFMNGRNLLEHQCEQIGHNQDANPPVDGFLIIALYVRI
jgi:hypothetical protein